MRGIEGITTEKEREVKEYSNPKEYFEVFRNWDGYKRAIENRKKECLEKNPSLTDKEIEEGFFISPKCKDLLWDLYEKEGLKLKYDEKYYSKEAREKLRAYWDILEEMRKVAQRYGKAGIPEKIATPFSAARIDAHDAAAIQISKEGIFPTEMIARNMIRFMTIDKGIELTRKEDEARRRFIEAQLLARV